MIGEQSRETEIVARDYQEDNRRHSETRDERVKGARAGERDKWCREEVKVQSKRLAAKITWIF